ncbi:MAG: 16S rRNA (cytidine(1402)-2'-O)-methyltransferase, partial [Candidatus Heritagella sp.]|nr:16S rRNA (cytidine(1402)-2'-O)-methyltransferase [Candidatus Heritagella sp.]
MSGTLYIVGTPIGNLGDFSPRAVEILQSVDFIAAEDTRVTLKLLNHFGIKKPMISYFEHNRFERGEIICQRLENGENAALVSDAGMPAISDPGELLVKQCAQRDIPVLAVPGPSAVVTALAVSGLPTGRFSFEGFLSTNRKGRSDHLQSLKNDPHTLVFYEAPHKLCRTLSDLYEVFGDRRIALVRELTKIHEEVFRTTLSGAIAHYAANPPRGEFVLVIEGAPEDTGETEPMTLQEAVRMARQQMEQGASAAAAAKEAAALSGLRKNEIYR